MTQRFALGALLAGTLLIAAAYAAQMVLRSAPAWAPWAYLVGMSTSMLAMLVLGAARSRGSIGRLALPIAFIYVLLLAGFGAALTLSPETTADATLWLGLPRRAAIVLYGIGILPLFLLPAAYALTFESMTLREEDMARVVDARREREALDDGEPVAGETA